MELIKLLQIEGVSETTQEDIIFNFLECIDEESALAIVEEYEQAETSLTESIINEVSLGYALKKSLGGAVQRFKDIRKKQADISTDRPIGLVGIRKQEAQKQDVAKSQERFKQAKSTAKDIVNRMLNTRYTRDNKGVTKAPDVKTEATKTTQATEVTKPVKTPEVQAVKTTKVVKTKAPDVKTQATKTTQATEVIKPAKTPKAKTTKVKTTKATRVKAPEVKTEATRTDNAKVAEVAKKTITKAKEEPKQEQSKTEAKKEEKQPVVVGVNPKVQAEDAKQNIIKRYNALKNKKNLTSGDLKLKQTMEDKYDFLS